MTVYMYFLILCLAVKESIYNCQVRHRRCVEYKLKYNIKYI